MNYLRTLPALAAIASLSFGSPAMAGPKDDLAELVRPKIIDLYVNAPDVMTPGRSRTYTMSAGRMTLVAELADSESGEVIARVLDRHEGRESGRMSWSSSVTNSAEADRAAGSWARILRGSLDKAKQIGGT